MKRVLALVLCFVMIFSMVACGNDTKPDENKKPGTSTAEPGDKEPMENTGNSDGDIDEQPVQQIRPNGELPNNERDLTDAEVNHYLDIIVNAALKLDIDTLREYAKNEDDLEAYQKIIDDATTKEWYSKTIGKSVYLPSIRVLVYPEPKAVFAMWQADAFKNNEELPEDATKMSIDELTAVYEKYKDKIPYCAEDISPKYDCPIYLKDGKIYFELDEVLGITTYCSYTEDLAPSEDSWYSETQHISAYVFGYNANTTADFNTLLADGAYDYAMPLLTGNMDELVAYMDGLKDEYDWNASPGERDYYLKGYKNYLKDDAIRAKVQAWMQENVISGFSSYGMDCWHKVHLDAYYLINDASDTEKALIQELPIFTQDYVEGGCKASDVFSVYFDIISDMAESGYIEYLL